MALGAAGVAGFSAGEAIAQGGSIRLSGSQIATSSLGAGVGGNITLSAAQDITLTNQSGIAAVAGFTGDGDLSGTGRGGDIRLSFGREGRFSGRSFVTADTTKLSAGSGSIQIDAPSGRLILDARNDVCPVSEPKCGLTRITANTSGTGRSGNISLSLDRLELLGGAPVVALATEGSTANSGNIVATVASLLLDGQGSVLGTSALNQADAGSIFIRSSGDVTIGPGAFIASDSTGGAAGSITIELPDHALFQLGGAQGPRSALSTSSGPGRGGAIAIRAPLAIIAGNAEILALGQSGGANVRIQTSAFLPRADIPNRIEVDGALSIEPVVADVYAGLEDPPPPVFDTTSTIIGQCAGTRRDGTTSQLSIQPTGHYRPTATDTAQVSVSC